MSLTDLIISLLGKAAAVAEDVMYIVLFLVFMLARDEAPKDKFSQTIDRQIFVYIRGKVSISAFVASARGRTETRDLTQTTDLTKTTDLTETS